MLAVPAALGLMLAASAPAGAAGLGEAAGLIAAQRDVVSEPAVQKVHKKKYRYRNYYYGPYLGYGYAYPYFGYGYAYPYYGYGYPYAYGYGYPYFGFGFYGYNKGYYGYRHGHRYHYKKWYGHSGRRR
jgi:hypothetical protein